MFLVALFIGLSLAVGLIVILRLGAFPRRVSMERFNSERLVVAEKGTELHAASARWLKDLYASTSARLEGKMDLSSSSARQLRMDLSMIGRTRRRHAEYKLTTGILGAIFGLIVGVGLTQLPFELPFAGILVVLVCLTGALFGFVIPDSLVKSEAEKARVEFDEMTLLWLDLVMPLIASGRDVSTAFLEATYLSRVWPFQLLGRYMNEARHLGKPIWAGLKKLIDEKGLVRLEQLSSALELSQRSGAEIRQTVIAQVHSYRAKAHSESVVRAEFASERMGAPLALTLAAFIVLIGYPATATLTGATDVFNLPASQSITVIMPFLFG